jgi:hypothetical protein
MRYLTHGRHARPGPSVLSYLLVLAASLAALIASVTFAGQSQTAKAAQAAPGARQVLAAQDTTAAAGHRAVQAAREAIAARAAAVLAARTYIVRRGDSISAVAGTRCQAARDWTGIYAASRALHWTARDANRISPGQRLYLHCAYEASQLKYATTTVSSTALTRAYVTRSRHYRRSWTSTAWTGSTRHDRFDGRHGRCGDGDGDGMDAPCSVIFPQHRAAAPVRHSYYRSTYHSTYHSSYRAAPGYSSAGTYSYAGLESLWISAGGPSWAASHAAEIAECESGGRTNAYNPSGATGLWQILGSVVAGNLDNAYTNALNAVSKFRASGDTFAQWVCR